MAYLECHYRKLHMGEGGREGGRSVHLGPHTRMGGGGGGGGGTSSICLQYNKDMCGPHPHPRVIGGGGRWQMSS